MSVPGIADWSNFFTVEVGAAATLAGLVIVAISINLARIIGIAGLPERGVETLTMLFGVVLAGSFGLVPGQPSAALGGEFLGTGAVMWLAIVAIQILAPRTPGEPRRSLPLRIVLGQITSLPFVIAGALVLSGAPGALFWLVPGVICCLVGAMLNTWVLLVEIVR